MANPLETVEYVHRVWPADPGQLSLIRCQMLSWLEPLGMTPDRNDDVVLAVGEAVENVVQHAYPEGGGGDVELTLWTETGALNIEITDHGLWQEPVAPVPDAAPAPGGRGIRMMQHTVETVLVHYDARGSRVLLRVALPSARPEPVEA
ncbi:ATP-binding protein [Pseudonocardia sp. T1-2H]|uniref:ATP-binding protein n=1 Tax=Pseudonocardia sp. T1-2H TaxID=3128899 RepID=UPI00310127F6